ncbi:MAG: hypothetical protein ACRC0E_10435 [Soonwooa sp.]
MFASKNTNALATGFYGGYRRQNDQDVNKDGFSDVAQIRSLVMHPKLYFYPSQNSSISLGWSESFDKNWSGDLLFIKNGKSFDHQ